MDITPHHRDPPRAPGRPRPLLAGLGDHGRRTGLGSHRPASGPRDGRRTDLGIENLPGRPRCEQERAVQRPGHRDRDGPDPRRRGQGGRPDLQARTPRLHPTRRPRTTTAAGPPHRPQLLLVPTHPAHPAAHPRRGRHTRRAQPPVRPARRRLRRPPRPARPPPARPTRHHPGSSPRRRPGPHRRRRDLDRPPALPRRHATPGPQAPRDDRARRPPHRGPRSRRSRRSN